VGLVGYRMSLRIGDKERAILSQLAGLTMGYTLRVAGGWVRDALLGRTQSHDVDLLVEGDVSPEDFARRVGEVEKQVSSFGLIKGNPLKGKHQDIATFRIRDLWIDVTVLPRSISIEQDALRRDFTINALYWNVNLEKVEDFTEKGLEDLKNKVIRTPLSPTETFIHDPLRILRAVRFAQVLGFEMDPEIMLAAQSEEVQKGLALVSRERFGIEIRKILESPNGSASRSFDTLARFGVLKTILDINEESFRRISDEGLQAMSIMET